MPALHLEPAAALQRHGGKVIAILALTVVVAALGLTVNPWPRDGWYETQGLLVGHFPGRDDYTPIAAPALLYRAAHAVAVALGFGLAGEFRVASLLQNGLLLLSACFVYYTLRRMRLPSLAGPLAIGFLLCVLSTGLPQCFYSENTTLFLMSAVLLVIAAMLYGSRGSKRRFWTLAGLSAVLIGLLAATRVVPIFLIPGIALLFWHRMPARRVAQLTVTLALTTTLMLAGMALANHARFGRYELTNSTGRHLWQGVKDIADQALARSSDYQALKRVDPHIGGQNWWQISPDMTTDRADWREPVLRKLSIEAMTDAPALYLTYGAKKFARTVGSAPFRLGFGVPGGGNPLERQEFLPPLASVMGAPPAFGAAVSGAFRGAYAVFAWIYPVTIFAIGLSYLAVAVERLDRFLEERATHRLAKRIVPGAIFLAAGASLTVIPVASRGLRLGAVLASVACLGLLAAGAAILRRTLGRKAESLRPREDMPFFVFLGGVFFGCLWLSWQVEYPDSRDTLAYFPLWPVMIAVAAVQWRRLVVGVRSPPRRADPYPSSSYQTRHRECTGAAAHAMRLVVRADRRGKGST